MNRVQNISGSGPPSFLLNKPQSKVESVAEARKKQLEAHYGDDWTEADKQLFDAMVKEEMSKVERSFKTQASLEDSNLKSTGKASSASGRYDDYSAPDSMMKSEGFRDLSGMDENKDYNSSFNHSQGSKPVPNARQWQHEFASKAPLSMSKADRYYADRDDTSEQSFTSKLGEYENSNRDQRKSRQQEYARQLSEQLSSNDSQGFPERNAVGRASSRVRRANTLQTDSSYQGTGTGLVVGTDPEYQRRMEKMKKQEYARQLGQQVSYQRTFNNMDGELSNRSRSYSDAKASVEMGAGPVSPMRNAYPTGGSLQPTNRAPYADSYVTGFQIGQDAADDKRRKKEKQQDYYRQLASDINDRSEIETSSQFQTRRPSRVRNNSEQELPGGGILNIGERQPVARNLSRSRIIGDQEFVDKKRLAQQDYFRLLEQDKVSQTGNSPAASMSKYQSRDVSYDTGLNIGRDQSSVSDRRQRQQEYRDALEQDSSLTRQYQPDRPSYSIARQNSGGDEPYRSPEPLVNQYAYDPPQNMAGQTSYEEERQTSMRNAPARVDFTNLPRSQPVASRSSMGDILSGGGSAVTPPLPSYRTGSGRAYQPSQGLPRTGSEGNYRTRGRSTGGGASTLVLG